MAEQKQPLKRPVNKTDPGDRQGSKPNAGIEEVDWRSDIKDGPFPEGPEEGTVKPGLIEEK